MNKPISLIRYVDDRPGHDVRYSLNTSKIKKTLGWSPEVSFEKGLEQTVEWYLQETDWWKSFSEKEVEL
jgi:dTDP-glucose 4,6-dehydratase